MFSPKEDFAIVPIDKAGNTMAFIGKHLYVLTIIKELSLDCHYQARIIVATPIDL